MQPELLACIVDSYEEHRGALRNTLAALEQRPTEFEAIEWRLSQVIASRALHRQHDTRYLVSIETSGQKEPHLLSCDVPTMAHIASELRTAYQERNSAFVKRVKRNVK